MTTITLEAIEAQQNKLAQMIAELKANAGKATEIHFPEALIALQPGEEYAGLIVGKDGEQSYHLVLLPGDADALNWKDAKSWAAGQGGELPTRREQSLLYANLKEHFQGVWYWSGQEHESESGWAWCQDFTDGGQYNYLQGLELRARAVRRLVIE